MDTSEAFEDANDLAGQWDWTSGRSADLAQQLIHAVKCAREYEDIRDSLEIQAEFDHLQARGWWELALLLADDLRDGEPGPLPPEVDDALSETEGASDILGFAAASDHGPRSL